MTSPRIRHFCYLLLAILIPVFVVALWLQSKMVYAINASHSLEAPAFALVTWPVLRDYGIFVSFNPPKELDRGFPFIKRITGIPGDHISIEDGQSCINGTCLTLTGEEPYFKTATPTQVIPEGYFYVAGDTPTSFDSRYAALGLISEDQIIAAGWALNFMPAWEGRQ